MKLNLVVMSRD